MDPSDPNTDDTTAMQIAKELNEVAAAGKPTEGITVVLQRIKDDVVWTNALLRTGGGRALELAIRTCSTLPERSSDKSLKALVVAVLDARHFQVREDDIREVEARWWHIEPVPTDAKRITLEFCDVTSRHKSFPIREVWPPEIVECVPSEPFEHAAQRFRVQANRKHRHPFWPSVHFDAILKNERTSLTALGMRTIADVAGALSEEHVVPYVRNDEDNHSEYRHSPARYFELWERTLPAWCATPDHWIEPIPPPGFVEHRQAPPALREQYYKKIPTLHISGNGRYIVPSTKKPDIISHSLFIPVEDRSPTLTRFVVCEREADLVPPGTHLTPGKIGIEEARALLGRVVQSSTEPRPDPDAPPVGKRRKVNKYASQTLGIAWGLETDPDGGPAWLHCVECNATGLLQYVLNLTGEGRQYEEHSPLAIRMITCAWVGAAVLPADQKAIEDAAETAESPSAGEAAAPVLPEKQALSFDNWYERTIKWIRVLNDKRFAPVVEVGADGMFVGGDLGISKGEDDEFEAEVAGAKPGIWLMSVEAVEAGDGSDGDEFISEESQLVRFGWKSDGAVSYDLLPVSADFRADAVGADDGAEWEAVGTFSVDSGQICLFSKHALEELLSTGTDKQAMLESLIDEDEGTNVFVPAGVVVLGNDGGYEIEGRRDAEERIVELRMRL